MVKMKQGTVDTTDLTKEQLRFTVNVMAKLMDELIQDDMDLSNDAMSLPADQQSDHLISKCMKLLQYN